MTKVGTMGYQLLHLFLVFNVFDHTVAKSVTNYRFPVYPVDACPKNAAEFERAAKRRNCSENTRYLCSPDKYLSNMIEFCTDRKKGLFGKGFCILLEGTGDLNHFSCTERFNSSCPDKPYNDDKLYKYPACLEINKDLNCFVADKDCKEKSPRSAVKTNGDYSIIAVFVIICVLVGTGIAALIMYKKRKEAGTDSINTDKLREFLRKGHLNISHTRGIIVGCAGAGKTTLFMRLQDMPWKDTTNINTTEIADVHVNSFEVLRKKMTIRVVKHKRVNEHQTITFSKEDMLGGQKKLPKKKSYLNGEDNKKRAKKCNAKNDQSLPLIQSNPENSSAMREVCSDNNENDDRHNEESNLENGNGQHPNSPQPQIHPCIGEIHDHADIMDISTIKSAVAENDAMSKILDAVKIISKEKQKHPRISFVDFGGQSMYYAFHQIFLSPKTFYILVLDMSKSPNDTVFETEDKCGSRFKTWKYKDYYKFWLRSIDSFSDINTPVIVVGTHAEDKSEKDCKIFFEEFFALFEGKEYLRRHLHTDRRFVIRFPTKGTTLENLTEIKNCIARLVQALPYWEETIRPSCAIFEHILHQQKHHKIISRETLSENNNTLDVEFRLSENEITEMLNFLNRVGSLLYIDEEELRNTVILDVHWFVGAFKCVIADSVEMEKTTNKESTIFHETGELQDHDLNTIWNKPKNKEERYFEHKEKILSYMEHMGLLTICSKTATQGVWYYFPSMNKRKLGKDLEKFKQYETSSILCLQFAEEGQLPMLVFYKLVSMCIGMSGWSILKEGEQKSIFENVACFSFKNHIVVICICQFQIQVQVCLPKDKISPEILHEVQATVVKEIRQLKKYKFKIGYKCERGVFCSEEDNSFIALDDFPIKKLLCNICKVAEKHFVSNDICWISHPHPDSLNISQKLKNFHEETDEGLTSILHIIQACLDGNIDNFLFHLKHEIGHRKHLLSKPYQNGWNVMHFAAKGGNLDIFQTFQSKDLNVCQKTHDQMTVLHIASLYGHFEICKYILENNDFRSILHAKSVSGKNACHYAAEAGFVQIFELLVKNCIDHQATTDKGQNVFHISCIYNQFEMCKYIAKHYHDLKSKESNEGWNATLYAAKNGNTKVLKLLKNEKVSFEHKSESSRNALHIACDNGHIEASKYISDICSSLLNARDDTGRYAFHFASRSGCIEILKDLELKTDVTQATYSGMNILHMACLHDHVEICRHILDQYPELNIQSTETCWTTAHFVAREGNNKGNEIKIFEMLLSSKKPVDISLLTKKKNSVLTIAIKYNSYDFTEFLLVNYPSLLNIPNANNPRKTGNNDLDMKIILDRHLKF